MNQVIRHVKAMQALRNASWPRVEDRGFGRARAGAVAAILAALVSLAALPRMAVAQHLPDLVTHDVLRVCADPANMPFSNRTGEGFENRIAAVLADDLKLPVRYYWQPQGPGFVHNTLGFKLCDVIIGYAAGTELVQHSNPYYRSVYVMLVRRGDLDGLKELADPRLKTKRIGVMAGTPPVDHLAAHELLGQAKPYSLLVDHRYASPATEMVADLAAGRIDVAILWGPAAGYLARHSGADLVLIPLLHEGDRPALAYRITLGLRPNEIEWKRTLNAVLHRREAEINAILLEYGVPLLDEDDHLITAAQGPEPKP